MVGMTELNKNSYNLAAVATNIFSLLSLNGKNITGATLADPVVITSADHGFSNGDIIGHLGILGMTELNGNIYKVANKTDDTYELNNTNDTTVDGTGFTAYISGGTVYHAINGTDFTAYISGGNVNKKVTAFTGLTHLEGEKAKVLADGYVAPDLTVASGAVTLGETASVAQFGLGYTHKIKTLKLIPGTVEGSPMGKTKQIFGLTFVLLNSHTLTFGPDSSNLRTIDFREVADLMGEAIPFFTGEHFESWDHDWDTDPRIVIQSSDPTPFVLLALVPETDVRESRG